MRRKEKQQYHHEGLRTALIEEASKMIAEGGVVNLTMRSIGERLGVSRSAAYRHFPDKSSVLVAVAEAGYEQLSDLISDINSGTKRSGIDRLKRTAEVYVRFALENPAHYRLMYGREALSRTELPQLREKGNALFDQILKIFRECQRSGELKRQDANAQAYIAWSAFHGLASLLIEGQILGPVNADSMIRQSAKALLEGMRSKR